MFLTGYTAAMVTYKQSKQPIIKIGCNDPSKSAGKLGELSHLK